MHDTLDIAAETCQTTNITELPSSDTMAAPFDINGGNSPKTSKRGGPRPGFGGPQPGSGRPRKQPIIVPDTNAPRWSVVATRGQAEQSAIQELTRSGYETYLPMVAIRKRDPVVKSMWHTVRVPYLSGYGFIRLTNTETREPVLQTRGVREILLRPDGRLAWVPDGEIDRLKANDVKRLELPKEHASILKVGTKVRLDEGPFADFPGEVMRCDGFRTQVGIEVFGRSVPVWLDRVAVVVII